MNERSAASVRGHALALAAASRNQAVATARREIEALRAAISAQLALLDQSLASDDPHPDVTGAVERLCDAAQVPVDFTRARLDDEIQSHQAAVGELSVANERLQQASADLEHLRLELQHAHERVRTLEQQHAAAGAAPADSAAAVLGQVARALSLLADSTTGTDVLATLVDQFAQRFSRVVLCSTDPIGFTIWRSRGFDPPLEPKTVLRVPPESPLARAAAAWSPVSSTTTIGVLGEPVRYAIALPIVAKGRGTAMLYAESRPGPIADDADRIAAPVAEILAHYVKARLQVKSTASVTDPAAPPKQRQARRVKMLDGTTVVVDNVEGMLVDLSTLGAQVLSPRAMRPNSAVRLVLDSDTGNVACSGRVVWVIVEHQPSSQSALYRAGVEFTDVKQGELDGYLEFFDSAITH